MSWCIDWSATAHVFSRRRYFQDLLTWREKISRRPQKKVFTQGVRRKNLNEKGCAIFFSETRHPRGACIHVSTNHSPYIILRFTMKRSYNTDLWLVKQTSSSLLHISPWGVMLQMLIGEGGQQWGQARGKQSLHFILSLQSNRSGTMASTLALVMVVLSGLPWANAGVWQFAWHVTLFAIITNALFCCSHSEHMYKCHCECTKNLNPVQLYLFSGIQRQIYPDRLPSQSSELQSTIYL